MSAPNVIRVYDAAVDDVDRTDMSLVVRANTSDVDFYRTVLLTKGIRLDHYNKLKRPVLWEHGKDLSRRFTDPIANCMWIRNNGGEFPTRILARPKFLSDDFSRQRWEWYRDGVINGWSINLLPDMDSASPPTQAELRSHPEWEGAEAIYRSGTLMELSGTVLPGNPSCLSGERAMKVMGLVERNLLWLPPEAEPVYRDAAASVSVSIPRAITDGEGGLSGGGATVKPEYEGAPDGGPHEVTQEEDGQWYARCMRCMGGPYKERSSAESHRCSEVVRDDMDGDDGDMGDLEMSAARAAEGEPKPDKHAPTHGVKKRGGKYVVVSNSGKLMGEYPGTPAGKAEAEKRVQAIEYFKHEGDRSGVSAPTPQPKSLADDDEDLERAAPEPEPGKKAPYGNCPHCGAPGVKRDGPNDTCQAGHVYPSKAALAAGMTDATEAEKAADMTADGADRSAPAYPPEVLAELERLRSSPPPTLSDVVRLELLRFRGWAADRQAREAEHRDLYERGRV